MIANALHKDVKKETSPILALYELQWFVGLWNENEFQGMNASYKEELCVALLQACLIETNLNPSAVNVCLEISEIASKVLDWRTSTLK